jgi:hypothetical protein
MNEFSLEELASRLVNLEKKVAEMDSRRPQKDWRRTVGMFKGSEFMAQVEADILAEREAERKAAREGETE